MASKARSTVTGLRPSRPSERTRHGDFSSRVVLCGESQETYDELEAAFIQLLNLATLMR
jgi:hypothetical protein